MSRMLIHLGDERIPMLDGEINEYAYTEARNNAEYFDDKRKIVFVNGMLNSGEDHAESALALSWVQMCTVIGVYNKSTSGWQDFQQCIGEKNTFNGPVSLSADNGVAIRRLFAGQSGAQAARNILARNPAQVALFDLLRRPEHQRREIFAHSQGNLIVSNTLQAIAAVDGAAAVTGWPVHTFGSPAVNWPQGVVKYEHGFTWDPVTWLAGFDTSFTISKVGMPRDSKNPVTHAFLEYLKSDPEFVVNRFRWGGLGITFNLDEAGLAKCLAAMGTNMHRVRDVFTHLKQCHSSDADDVAELYVDEVRRSVTLTRALKLERELVKMLTDLLSRGWTSASEKRAIQFLKTL